MLAPIGAFVKFDLGNLAIRELEDDRSLHKPLLRYNNHYCLTKRMPGCYNSLIVVYNSSLNFPGPKRPWQ